MHRNLQPSGSVVRQLLLTGMCCALAAPAAGQTTLLQPDDLTYVGAFRLPEVTSDPPEAWDWGVEAMAFSPTGDSSGSGDGYPGSIFASGIGTENYVSEVSIPAPSSSRTIESLPRATTIQPFADVRGGLFDLFTEQARIGLEILPVQAGQSSSKLYIAYGQHHHDDVGVNIIPTHAWCELDLGWPDTKGAWWVGDQETAATGFIYSTNGYLFTIPDAWADDTVGGKRLATGRYRDGGWTGMGPSLHAIAPWLDGSPPAAGAELSFKTLLQYSSTLFSEDDHRLDGYSHADSWEGGAWVTAGDSSAVVFVGTKASGYTWYGFATPDEVPRPPLFDGAAPCPFEDQGEYMCFQPDGTTPCTEAELHLCDNAGVGAEGRRWWASRFDAQILFYDPADLAAVAAGSMEAYEPQPYAVLDIDQYLYLGPTTPDVTVYMGAGDQRQNRVHEAAYDRNNNLLYVPELFADQAIPLIHVFRVEAGSGPTTHRLTVTRSGNGAGTVTSTPPGIACGNDCSHDYSAGTQVELTATPSDGSTFAGWSGACTGTAACTVTLNSNRSVGAIFETSGGTFDHRAVIPVVAHAIGAAGSQWRSSVVCLNPTTSAANALITLIHGAGPVSRTVTIPPGATVEWDDIVVGLLQLPAAASNSGALRIESDQPLRFTSRTYNQGDAGTFGQYLPALGLSDVFAGADRGTLLNIKGGNFRTNIGFVSLGDGACSLRVTLYDTNGDAAGDSISVQVPADRWVQVNDVFSAANTASLNLAYATIERVSGDGGFWAYASVVDGETGDATTIPVMREE